jgi:hypothetical protein
MLIYRKGEEFIHSCGFFFFFCHFAHGVFGINITGKIILADSNQKKAAKLLQSDSPDFGDLLMQFCPRQLSNISRLGV